MSIDIDVAIVVGFLLLNLGVGLYYGQGVKTIREYALGGRNFTTATLTATIIATWIGGDNFSLYLSETYTEGLFFILSSFGALAAFLIVGYLYAPKMTEFLGSLSIAEAMGTLYGKYARLITALVGCVLITTLVSIQFKIASTMLSHLLGVSGIYTTIASAVVVIIYSSLGGIKSVTFTDIVQFFTFGSVIPLIALIVWSGIDDVDMVVTTLQSNPLFDVGVLLDYSTPRFWSFLTLMLLFIIPGFDPSTFQRMSMSKDTKQLRKAFIYAAFIVLVVQLLISWISVLILSRESGLDPDNLFGYILENYSYVGLKGIFVVGVLTMVMSTADSGLNSGAVMFAYDIANTLRIIKPDQELLVSRISVVVIGSIALLLAIKFDNLFELFIFGYSFYMPIVTVPFTLAVLGFRTSSKTALIGMGSGFLTALGWMFLDTEVDSVIPGLLANLLAMLAYHYLTSQPGGWSPKTKNINLGKITVFKKKLSDIRQFSVVQFCKKSMPKNESAYVFFSIFAIISIFSTSYSIPSATIDQYPGLINVLYFSTLIIASYFLTYQMWPVSWYNKGIMSVVWMASLFYILVFVVGLLVLVSNFGQFQLIMFLFSMIVLSVLVRWQAALFLIITGVVSSIQFFKYNYPDVGQINSDLDNLEFKIIYVLILLGGILMAFLKPNQEYLESIEGRVGDLDNEVVNLNKTVTHYSERISDQQQEIERLGATAQKILNNVHHELRLPVGNVMNFAEMLNDGLEGYSKEQLKMLSDEVYKNSNRLSSMILNMLNLATLDVKKIELQCTIVNFSELVVDRINSCRGVYMQDKKINFVLEIENEVMISVDPNYIRQTVDNLVINAIRFSEDGEITVKVLKQKNFVEFTIIDQGRGIPHTELYDIFTPFKMGSNSNSNAEGRGVGLALCKSAIEAHGGVIQAHSKGKGAMFKFVLLIV
jgi:Na+/proline symporter/signal transduction histidine kinase